MESTFKNLFRRRSKSRPPAPKNVTQESFQQTSSYAAVPPGPAPKLGTLPLKPSQEQQRARSVSHTKAKSDGWQETRQVVESANIGRPRTSQGVKPYFVGVSRPAGSAIPSAPSSRGTSIDLPPALYEPPTVPPLPKNVHSLRGPRYHDIMQFAAEQHISRATFNEHVATRNMSLPRKSVDVFEAEVNQLSGGRYNGYVAIRNDEVPHRPIDRFEEEVALRNAALPDTQRASFDALRGSREDQRPGSRNNTMDKHSAKTPGQSVTGAASLVNNHVTRTGKDKSWIKGSDGQSSGPDVPPKATASRSQTPPSPKPTLHSRKRSTKENARPGELSSIPQSRPADFMPPEWLSHCAKKASSSSDGNVTSMTVAITSPSPREDIGDSGNLSHGSTHDKSKIHARPSGQARTQFPQHSLSRSLSVLEGSSAQEALSSATSSGIRRETAERSAVVEKKSSNAGNTLSGAIAGKALPDRPGSALSSGRSSTLRSTTSVMKRFEPSGRTVMDLTAERSGSSMNSRSHPVHQDLSVDPRRGGVYYQNQPHKLLTITSQSATDAPGQHAASEVVSPEWVSSLAAASPQVERTKEPDTAKIQRQEIEAVSVVPRGSGNGNETKTTERTSQPPAVFEATNIQPASIHASVTVPVELSATESLQQNKMLIKNRDESVPTPAETLYATPESLKSDDFKNPSRAFGITARDFALSPSQKKARDTLKKTTDRGTSTSNDVAPSSSKTLHAGQEKVVHHISSFTLPAKQPGKKRFSRDYTTFDEDAFQRKQSEARAALLRLERDLQENFGFTFDSLQKTSAQATPVHFRDLSVEDTGPVAPVSRFSSVHAPNSVYQSRGNGTPSPAERSLAERSPSHGSVTSALATNGDAPVPSIPNLPRSSKRDSTLSTMSQSISEKQPNSAPMPSVPFYAASDRGRSVTSRTSAHGRVHSTASTRSGASAFSLPLHLVPERTSSLKDAEVPLFSIDDARWE